MKKILTLALTLAALPLLAGSYERTSFFDSAVTNVAINLTTTNGVGQTGATFTFTPTSTNNVVFYTGDGVYHYPLSSTNVTANYISATRTEWTNTVVNTNVLNGLLGGAATLKADANAQVLPASMYVTMVGTNSSQNSAVSFNFAASIDGTNVATGTTYSYFTFVATGNGVTPVTVITNLPTTWQCAKWINLVSIVGTTNAGAYLHIGKLGVAQFCP